MSAWPREEFDGFGTHAIHAGQEPEKWDCRAVVPLIGLSTTFKPTVRNNPTSNNRA